MESDLINLLRSCKIFSSLDDDILKQLLSKFQKIYLDKDKRLFKQGELSNHIYLLVEGKIAVFFKTKSNEKILINEYLPGALIGELTALSHEPRSATARAVKKSLLLKLPSEDFIEICKKNNSVSLEIINTTFSESRNIIKAISDKGQPKKHIAIIPANEKVKLNIVCEEISKYKNHFPSIHIMSDSEKLEKQTLSELVNDIEKMDQENKTIIYLIESNLSKLAELCFGHERVDMIYVVALADSELRISDETNERINNNKYKINPELILIHKKELNFPKKTSKWLKLIDVNLHHHIRVSKVDDWQRLLRFITGNAIGLVLGGGGLRCWTQLGALMAIRKLNIPIDAIGGSSAGAIVAGYYAMKQSFEDIHLLKELSKITHDTVSLKNFTWPSASLFDGKDYTNKLKEIFGSLKIENIWIPCFCITTNLAKNKQIISRKGYLWKIIRSSTSVPLIFPPIVSSGKLHLDGGLLNNLPVDIMKKIISNKNTVIAVELTHNNEDKNNYYFPAILPFWQTFMAKMGLSNKQYHFPHLIDTFLKSLLSGSSSKQKENSKLADILINPDLSKFSLLNVDENDAKKLIKIGYKSTIKKLKQFSLVLNKK